MTDHTPRHDVIALLIWALAFAWFCLFVFGCAGDYSGAARTAADRWEAACGVRPEPDSVTILDVPGVSCADVAAAAGCTRRSGLKIDVTVAARSSSAVADTLMHEFGHVLGAKHLREGVGVMVATMNTSRWRPCLTADDLESVGTCTVLRPECN